MIHITLPATQLPKLFMKCNKFNLQLMEITSDHLQLGCLPTADEAEQEYLNDDGCEWWLATDVSH